MIPAAAVNAYLDRPLQDHMWAKDLTPEEVDGAIGALEPAPDLWPDLRHHQKVCFLLGVAYPGFGFWLDMGTGKTLLSLELLKYWWKVRAIRRAIVFVTSDKAFDTWERQIERFKVGLPYTALEGSSDEKWDQLRRQDEGIVLLTYPGAVAMASRVLPGKGRGKKRRWVLDREKVERLGQWAGALVWDESTRVGNHRSLAYQLSAQLRLRTDLRYALAGRPFGRDPTMLWPQFFLLDDGDTLGPTLGLFRAAFFREQKNRFDRSGRARDYIFQKRMQPALSRMVQNRSVTYAAEECIDLPVVTRIQEEVSFPGEAEAYYRRVIDQIIQAKGKVQEMKNAFIRMRQVSSGFVGVRDDETGQKAQIEFGENPKLDRLLDLVYEMPPDRKMVVFYEFTWSGRRIVEALGEMGRHPIWLWSGTKDARLDINKFQTDPACQDAVINNRVGAYSLDGLQEVANYLVFYESPVSVIDREQAEKRLIREGQELRVFMYDLLVRGSYDHRILEFHQEGGDLFEALLRDPERVLSTRR